MKFSIFIKQLVSVALIAFFISTESPGVLSTFGFINNSANICSAASIYEYYPKCSSSYSSLAKALDSINVNSSFSFRKNYIAPLNGYSSSTYTGSVAQNNALLKLLKKGKLVKSVKTAPDSSWSNIPAGDYVLVPKCAPNSCMDITSWGTSSGSNVQIWRIEKGQKRQIRYTCKLYV